LTSSANERNLPLIVIAISHRQGIRDEGQLPTHEYRSGTFNVSWLFTSPPCLPPYL